MRQLYRSNESKSVLYFLAIVVFCLSSLLVLPSTTSAQVAATNSSSTSPTITGDRQGLKEPTPTISESQRVANLRTQLTHEINKRITALQEILTKIPEFKRLTDDQKATLTTQVQAEINTLTALQKKVGEGTTVLTLKRDLQTLRTSFKVYAFYVPKVKLLSASEKMIDTSVHMASFAATLQTKIQEASAQGKDITAMQEAVDTMNEEIGSAKVAATNAENLVSPTTAAGFPGNKSTMQRARTMLTTSREHLTNARQEASLILSELKK